MRLSGVSYLGRYQVGQEVPLILWVRNQDRTPSFPDDVPLARVVDSSGSHIASVKMPVVDRYTVTGLFQAYLPLSTEYAVGKYTVEYQYRVSGYSGLLLATFEVVPGGDVGGSVISLYTVERPEARYVVAQLDTGRLVAGRNPTI